MDLKIFEPLSGCICYFYIIHYTLYILAPLIMLEQFCGHCGTLPRLRGPPGRKIIDNGQFRPWLVGISFKQTVVGISFQHSGMGIVFQNIGIGI